MPSERPTFTGYVLEAWFGGMIEALMFYPWSFVCSWIGPSSVVLNLVVPGDFSVSTSRVSLNRLQRHFCSFIQYHILPNQCPNSPENVNWSNKCLKGMTEYAYLQLDFQAVQSPWIEPYTYEYTNGDGTDFIDRDGDLQLADYVWTAHTPLLYHKWWDKIITWHKQDIWHPVDAKWNTCHMLTESCVLNPFYQHFLHTLSLSS